jgi:hypothetical protein
VKTAQQAAANWSGSAGRAQADWTTGVQNYSGDWANATVSQGNAYITNVQAAYANGSWANGINRIGTAGWKAATQSKSANYATGFAAGAANQAAAAQKIMSALSNIVPSLPPRGSFQQNVTRATTLMNDLHALKGSLGA